MDDRGKEDGTNEELPIEIRYICTADSRPFRHQDPLVLEELRRMFVLRYFAKVLESYTGG